MGRLEVLKEVNRKNNPSLALRGVLVFIVSETNQEQRGLFNPKYFLQGICLLAVNRQSHRDFHFLELRIS